MKTCCFIGHRKIDVTDELIKRIEIAVEAAILQGVEVFYLGKGGAFDDLCYEIVSDMKTRYPQIKRIYVRAEYPIASEVLQQYLLKLYEDTFYPPQMKGNGRTIYIKRNQLMIKESDCCIFYYDPEYISISRASKSEDSSKPAKSGTAVAFDYASKKHKIVINTFEPFYTQTANEE